MAVFLRTANNYSMREASRRVALAPYVAKDGVDGKFKPGDVLESLTKQSFKEESDINTIVRRFGLTGELPSDLRVPLNGDFTEVPDFSTAMQMIVEARESFDALPAHLRARFHNDAREFVDFVSDDSNRAEAEKLGLVVRKGVAGDARVDVVPPPGAADAAAPKAP